MLFVITSNGVAIIVFFVDKICKLCTEHKLNLCSFHCELAAFNFLFFHHNALDNMAMSL